MVDPELNEQSLVLRLRSMVSWLSMVVHVKGRRLKNLTDLAVCVFVASKK